MHDPADVLPREAGLAGDSGNRDAFRALTRSKGVLDETCSFPVLIEPTAPDVSNFFVFSDGKIFGSAPFVGTATNVDTGKSVKINLSGSFSVVEHSDRTTTITSNGFVLSTLSGPSFPDTASWSLMPPET